METGVVELVWILQVTTAHHKGANLGNRGISRVTSPLRGFFAPSVAKTATYIPYKVGTY